MKLTVPEHLRALAVCSHMRKLVLRVLGWDVRSFSVAAALLASG